MTEDVGPRLGAAYLGAGRTEFLVWAPRAEQVDVRIVSPGERREPLVRHERGYFHAVLEGVEPGARYLYRLDDARELPDPASAHQPEGVHGPSEVVNPEFAWTDQAWRGRPLGNYIIYELHIGTFTAEGTFESAIALLDELVELGVTAIEIMPIAQFPGGRNWGYDGVYPFAAQNSHGGPEGLRKLVDACHARGLAVVLDVVYNHFGPEGNYVNEFGHYCTDRYHTAWGSAVNFDADDSDEVRRFFIENALRWVDDFHIDALRLDAVHAIFDESAFPFLRELGVAVHERAERLNRRIHVIAESDRNDARHVQPVEIGGFGLDAQWSDDLHHALHTLLTGERLGYYDDFGQLDDLVKAYREGFVYSGQYSRHRRRRHGVSSRNVPAGRLVIFAQNHDQVGNRMRGERLSQLVNTEQLKLAAGLVLLSPYIPLLFMGEEYGEPAPFLYFVSHGDKGLIEAVREGRARDFASFHWQGEVPDPQSEETFRRSMPDRGLRREGVHRILWDWHRELIHIRRDEPALAALSNEQMEVVGHDAARAFSARRWNAGHEACLLFNLSDKPTNLAVKLPRGAWEKRLDSAEAKWGGPGSELPDRFESGGVDSDSLVQLSAPPHGCALFLQQRGF